MYYLETVTGVLNDPAWLVFGATVAVGLVTILAILFYPFSRD